MLADCRSQCTGTWPTWRCATIAPTPALGFAHVLPDEPELWRLHRWRDAMHGAGGSTYRKTHLSPAPCRCNQHRVQVHGTWPADGRPMEVLKMPHTHKVRGMGGRTQVTRH